MVILSESKVGIDVKTVGMYCLMHCFADVVRVPVSRARSSPVPGVVAYGNLPITARTAPNVTNHDDACRMQIYCRARSSRLRSRKEE